MPLRLNVGLSKKIGQPDYGSLGATCHVEVELDGSLVQQDLETFLAEFAAADAKLAAKFAKLEGKFACNTTGDATPVGQTVDGFADFAMGAYRLIDQQTTSIPAHHRLDLSSVEHARATEQPEQVRHGRCRRERPVAAVEQARGLGDSEQCLQGSFGSRPGEVVVEPRKVVGDRLAGVAPIGRHQPQHVDP